MASLRVLLLPMLLVPGAAQAQHYLFVRATPAASDSTTDPGVDVVEAMDERGVAGVNPNYLDSEARVNAATGSLRVASALSLIAGSGDPISYTGTSIDPVALIEETVEVQDLGAGVLRASLSVDGGAAVSVNGPGLGPIFDLQVTLRLGPACQAFYRQFWSVGSDPPQFTDDCTAFPENTASFDGNTLAVEVGRLSEHMELTAQVLVDTAYFGNDAASFQFDGALRFEATGATATFASPGFLSEVPEPGSSALGLAAIGALALRARGARAA